MAGKRRRGFYKQFNLSGSVKQLPLMAVVTRADPNSDEI